MVFIFIICEIGFFISTSLSMPLLFFACKSHFFNLVRFIKKKFFKKEKLTSELIDNKEKKESLTPLAKNIIIIILYSSILILAITVEKIIIIDNIVGSTGVNIVTFLFPATFYLKFVKGKIYSFQKLMAILFLFLGFSITGIFIKLQIDKIIN
jgi:amino acid permease